MALIKTQLTIQQGAKPGFYRFTISGEDITPLIKLAKIELFNRSELTAKMSLKTPVDLPDDKAVILFTGAKANGFNRSN